MDVKKMPDGSWRIRVYAGDNGAELNGTVEKFHGYTGSWRIHTERDESHRVSIRVDPFGRIDTRYKYGETIRDCERPSDLLECAKGKDFKRLTFRLY